MTNRRGQMRGDRRWNSEKQKWEYPVIDHIDGNPRNNDLANLMAVWPADNTTLRPSPTVEREKAARERYHNDPRFRAIAMSIVARVLQEHGPVDPGRADREAGDIATKVAALVMETLFTEDRELGEQRALADRYRKLAEDALALSPMPMMVLSAARPSEAEGPKK